MTQAPHSTLSAAALALQAQFAREASAAQIAGDIIGAQIARKSTRFVVWMDSIPGEQLLTELFGPDIHEITRRDRERRAGQALLRGAKRRQERKPRVPRRIPSPETITPTTPLRLDIAAQIAFPDGSVGVSGLRREIARGNLRAERIAGKIFVTLAAIQDMRTQCAVQKGQDSTSANRDDGAAKSGGSSSTATPMDTRSRSAQAHLEAVAQRLKSSSRITSPKSTSPASAAVIPLKS